MSLRNGHTAVHAERHGDRIFTRSPWNPSASGEAKAIPGGSWRKTERVWSYPLSLPVCRKLRQVYGSRLEIGPELWKWAAKQVAREEKLTKLGKEMDAELHLVPQISPGMAQAMANRTYQRSGAAFIREAKRCLIADEPSLGKSVMSLAGIMENGTWEGQHLIVAPLTALDSTWGRQIRQWAPDAAVFAMPEGRPKREKTFEAFRASTAKTKFLVVNPNMLQILSEDFCKKCNEWMKVIQPNKKDMPDPKWAAHFGEGHKVKKADSKVVWPELFAIEWTNVVVDEIHELLSAYKPSNVTQTTEGLLRLKIHPDGVKLGLTGTPLRGRELKIWGILSWLGLIKGGFWAWVDSYFIKDSNGFGVEIKGINPESELDFYRALDSSVLRRLKSEVKEDLPENLNIDHWIEMTPKQKRDYDKFYDEGELEMKSGLLSSTGVLSELTRLRQLAFGEWDVDGYTLDKKGNKVARLKPGGNSGKFDRLLVLLRERGVTGNPKEDFRASDTGFKYVVGSQFTQVLDFLEQKFNKAGIQTLKITGSVSGRNRTAVVKQFDESEDGPRVLLINTKAGGVSIDLDTYCEEMFIVDETYVDDDTVQLRGRIDNRKGKVRVRTYHYLRAVGTIEEDIARNNVDQASLAAKILDHRRGSKVVARTLSSKEK